MALYGKTEKRQCLGGECIVVEMHNAKSGLIRREKCRGDLFAFMLDR